jgi:hypothetical protein
MGPHSFFDLATIHILTTATLDRLRQLNPEGRSEIPEAPAELGVYGLFPAGVNWFLAMNATAESTTMLTSRRLVLSNSGTAEEVDELVVLVVVDDDEWVVLDELVLDVLFVVVDDVLLEVVDELLVTVWVEYRKAVVAPICVPLPPQATVTV